VIGIGLFLLGLTLFIPGVTVRRTMLNGTRQLEKTSST